MAAQGLDPLLRIGGRCGAQVVQQRRQQPERNVELAHHVGGLGQAPAALQREGVGRAERPRAPLHGLGQPLEAGAQVAQGVEAAADQRTQFGRHFGLAREVGVDALRGRAQQVGRRHHAATARARHGLREDRRDEGLDLLSARQCHACALGLAPGPVELPQRRHGAAGQCEQHQHLRIGAAEQRHAHGTGNRHLGLVAGEPAAGAVAERRRAGLHRLAGEVACQVIGQRIDARVTLRGRPGQCLGEHGNPIPPGSSPSG